MLRRFDLFQKAFLIILPVMVFVSVYLIHRYDVILTETKEQMLERAIMQNMLMLENLARHLQRLTEEGNLLELGHNVSLNEQAEQLLQVAVAGDIQNLFIVFRDAQGGYRFLLDAEEDPEQKAVFRQPFHPVSTLWDEVYETKLDGRTEHVQMDNLWITIAIPIMEDQKVAAVLGADISYRMETSVSANLHSFRALFSSVALFFSAMMLLVIVLMFFYERRRSRSFKDPLTGAYNRAFFYEVVAAHGLSRYHLMLCDLDHFKTINDTYGHDVGDLVLKKAARRIMKQIRKEDIFIRYGGEEFLLLVRKKRTQDSIELAKRLLKVLSADPIAFENGAVTVTVSIGLNPNLNVQTTMDEAIKQADTALYRAKSGGRNRVEVYMNP